MGLLRRLGRLFGQERLPAGFGGDLDEDEHVVAVAEGSQGSPFVATNFGLWAPDATGTRRIAWHLISKATWGDGILAVTESDPAGTAGEAVLLHDRPPQRFSLAVPGKLPDVVHSRVTGSIASSHHRDFAGGSAWFVQRKLPTGGVTLQVRPDPGTDQNALIEVAAAAAQRLNAARTQQQER